MTNKWFKYKDKTKNINFLKKFFFDKIANKNITNQNKFLY